MKKTILVTDGWKATVAAVKEGFESREWLVRLRLVAQSGEPAIVQKRTVGQQAMQEKFSLKLRLQEPPDEPHVGVRSADAGEAENFFLPAATMQKQTYVDPGVHALKKTISGAAAKRTV